MMKIREGSILDGKYILQKLVYEDEVSKIYDVWHITRQHPLQAKIITSSLTPEYKQKVTQEAKSWIELGVHPNIVCAYSTREVDGRLLLFMEKHQGKQLSDIQIHYSRENFAKILEVALQISHAMEYLHEERVYHGNLRLDNVILVDSIVKITNIKWDFSEDLKNIAKGLRPSLPFAEEEKLMKRKAQKKFAYFCPEYFTQKTFSKDQNFAADVYAFGVLLYHLCSGQFPFYDDQTELKKLFFSYAKAHQQTPPSLQQKFPDIPEGFTGLLSDCLAKEPEKRPSFDKIAQRLLELYSKTTGKSYALECWNSTDLLSMSLNNRALQKIDEEEYEEVEKILEEVSLLHTRRVAAPLNLCLLKLRNNKMTIREFVSSLRILKLIDRRTCLTVQAFTCIEFGSYIQDTLEEFLKFPETEKDDIMWFLEANLHYRIANYKRAKEIFKTLLKRENAVQDTCYRLGACCLALNSPQEAKQAWEIGLRQPLPSLDLLISYGMLLSSQNQWVKARKCFDQGMRDLPFYPSFEPTSIWSHVRTFTCSRKHSVLDVAISNDKEYILGTVTDGTGCIWRWPSGEEQRGPNLNAEEEKDEAIASTFGNQHNRDSEILDVVFACDGKVTFTIHKDNVLRVWDIESNQCLHELVGHSHIITCIAVTPDGKRAISGGLDKKLKVWDIFEGQCLMTLDGHQDCISRVAISEEGEIVISGGWDKTVCLWDILNSECIAKLKGHKGDITALAISPEGGLAVSGDATGMIRIWDVPSRKCIAVLEGHQGSITGLSISSDKSIILSGGRDGTIRVHENIQERLNPCWLRTPYLIESLPKPTSLEQRQKKMQIFEEAKKHLENYQAAKAITSYQKILQDCSEVSLYKSTMEKISQIAKQNSLTAKQLKSHRLLTIFPHKEGINDFLTISSDCFFSISKNSVLHRWYVTDGSCDVFWSRPEYRLNCLAMSPDREILCFGGADCIVRIWYPDSDSWIDLEGHTGGIYHLCFSENALFSAGSDGTIQSWDWQKATAKDIYFGHNKGVTGLLTLEDTSVVSCSIDATFRKWDTSSGENEILALSCSAFLSMHSPKNQKVILAGNLSGELLIWDVDKESSNTQQIYTTGITSIFAQNNNLALLGGQDGTIKLWDYSSQETLASIPAHSGVVKQVYLSPDGFWGYSAGVDGMVKLWAFEWEF